MFIWTRHMTGTQSERGGRRQVLAVRGHHHAFVRLKIERRGGREIDLGLRLVIAGDLGAENLRSTGRSLRRARSTISEMLPFETGASR